MTIRIFDVRGALVASIPQTSQSAGPHTAVWDGVDSQGNPVTSGTYSCELTAGGQTCAMKLLVVR